MLGVNARRTLVVLVSMLVALPAAAYAGKRVVSGQQSLQVKVKLGRARAGASGVSLNLSVSYLSTQPGGGQPPYNTKSVTFTLAPGAALNTSLVPSCAESKVVKAKQGAAICPAKSKVGSGSVVVNARPAIAKLISGTVTVYNGVDDHGVGGYPKGSRELILFIKTSIGVNVSALFHITKSGGRLRLTENEAKPAKPGIVPGEFTIHSLKLSIFASAKKPFVVDPPTCHGSWRFSLTIKNWFGQPSVTAYDRVKCHT